MTNVSLFEKPNETMSFFSKCYSKHFVKTRWLIFFLFCVMQTFYFQKCIGTLLRKSFAHKSFIQRENNASCLISYFDVLL